MVNTPARRTAPVITVIDGQPTTTSRDIAETFGKPHRDVLQRIKSLDCSDEFRVRNFSQASFEVQQPNGGTATYIEYRITRDGFAFLCMGFTGAKAAQWKEKYIATFNKMADKLANHLPDAKKMIAAQPLALPAPRLSAEAMAALDARAGQIAGSAYAEVRQWLLSQVLAGCVRPDGTPAPNFANTLAGADFAAFTTNYANKQLDTIARMLNFIQQESGALIGRVEAERQKLDRQAGGGSHV